MGGIVATRLPWRSKRWAHERMEVERAAAAAELHRRWQMSPELARLVGLKIPGERAADPETMLDWALHWGKLGLHVFPCSRCLGSPLLMKPNEWYSAAVPHTAKIIEWWSEHRDADIGAVPSKSDHYVIIAAGASGADSLAEIEEEYGPLK